MTELSRYGKLVRSYAGQGCLRWADDGIIPCSFECAQLADGRIICLCNLREVLGPEQLEKVSSLQGMTNDGRKVEVSRVSFVRVQHRWSSQNSEHTVIFLARELHVGEAQRRVPVRMCFTLVNFEFLGTERYEEHLQLRWTLEGHEVLIRPVEDYQEAVRGIKATRGIDVTAIATISLLNPDDTDRPVQLVDDLCLLLSLARGCRVQWLFWDALSNTEQVIESRHRDAITKPYSPLLLIPVVPPGDTQHLIERCFEPLHRKRGGWELQKAIEAYTDAKLEQDYLEFRGLKMAVLMDFVRGCYMNLTGKQLILDKQVFEDQLEALKGRLKDVLRDIFPDASDQQIEIMVGHVQGMNWYPFRRSLREMFAHLDLAVSRDELQRFVNVRNKLVHEARFASADGWPDYVMMMTLIGRTLLAVLEYDGHYYNWTKPAGWVSADMEMRVKMEYVSARQENNEWHE